MGAFTPANIAVFVVLVAAALFLDLAAHRQDRPIAMRDAALWSLFWVLLSLGFAAYIGLSHGRSQGMLFVAGYFLEKSLSVDNLFVFIAIFVSFSIQAELQHRVLYYGILGAIVMRLIFVGLGGSLIALLGKGFLALCGVFVLWTAWKMWRQSREEAREQKDYSNHWAVRLTRRFFPVCPQLAGHAFLVRRDGVLMATPLLLCLVVIEFADVLFAFDSVPAIFALFTGLEDSLDIPTQTFLVYTSNIFAILGLRSLYFLLAAANRFLRHLEKSVIAILVFIGLKMLAGVAEVVHVPAEVNLFIVLGLLSVGVFASLARPGPKAQ
ncbi:MAG: TerC/Alx family metal homeostasis membrane protein [Desulfovibrio sp.]|jgi:tellurite resistance protein TerC|nr:TerC/Alx family metal homeostasis membrane protein [Desulfovibrio sp.]